MIRKEITVGYAVRELRSRISQGPRERLFRALSAVLKLCAFLLKLGLVFVLAAFAYSAFGSAAAMITLAVLLAWLLVPITAESIKRYGKGRKGIDIGTSYKRIVEQYANADAKPRRGTSSLSQSRESYISHHLLYAAPQILEPEQQSARGTHGTSPQQSLFQRAP